MDLFLTNIAFRSDGIFGELRDTQGDLLAVTLQHAYPDANGAPLPKVPDGVYTCVRGLHQLAGMAAPFETFEVTNVPGHTGILFHVGNFQRDSSGCILVGSGITEMTGQQVLSASAVAFKKFMNYQDGFDQFMLTVKST